MSPPRITWYRLTFLAAMTGLLVPKAIYSGSKAASTLDWVAGIIIAYVWYILGWWEAEPPIFLAWFFHTDWEYQFQMLKEARKFLIFLGSGILFIAAICLITVAVLVSRRARKSKEEKISILPCSPYTLSVRGLSLTIRKDMCDHQGIGVAEPATPDARTEASTLTPLSEQPVQTLTSVSTTIIPIDITQTPETATDTPSLPPPASSVPGTTSTPTPPNEMPPTPSTIMPTPGVPSITSESRSTIIPTITPTPMTLSTPYPPIPEAPTSTPGPPTLPTPGIPPITPGRTPTPIIVLNPSTLNFTWSWDVTPGTYSMPFCFETSDSTTVCISWETTYIHACVVLLTIGYLRLLSRYANSRLRRMTREGQAIGARMSRMLLEISSVSNLLMCGALILATYLDTTRFQYLILSALRNRGLTSTNRISEDLVSLAFVAVTQSFSMGATKRIWNTGSARLYAILCSSPTMKLYYRVLILELTFRVALISVYCLVHTSTITALLYIASLQIASAVFTK
ncbi:hypothetical protein AX17_002032 [Amanita inopinata Kibby_2008]|nr:hypothetical protein AX17_002032 [Amanita inopinata Kibby_2008]